MASRTSRPGNRSISNSGRWRSARRRGVHDDRPLSPGGERCDLSRRGRTTGASITNGRSSLPLPSPTSQPFELALVGACAGRSGASGAARLAREARPSRCRWTSSAAIPDFIRRSRAEFTVAKDQNVRLRSGWFSERDACYLATGKPVVAQDTGFRNVIPNGPGSVRLHDGGRGVARRSRRSTPTIAVIATRRGPSPRSTSRRKPWPRGCWPASVWRSPRARSRSYRGGMDPWTCCFPTG